MNNQEVMDKLNAGKRVVLGDIIGDDLNGIRETRKAYQQGYVSRKKLYKDLVVRYSKRCKSLYYEAASWKTSRYFTRVYFEIPEPKVENFNFPRDEMIDLFGLEAILKMEKNSKVKI